MAINHPKVERFLQIGRDGDYGVGTAERAVFTMLRLRRTLKTVKVPAA
jgi:hypothetical protein